MNKKWDDILKEWMMKQIDGFLYPVWVILFLITCGPILIYILNFHSLRISKNPDDWAHFGDYLSPFMALSGTFIIGILTYKLFNLEVNRDTPILRISRITPSVDVYNTGKADAFNIKVIYHSDSGDTSERIDIMGPDDSYPFPVPNSSCTGITVEFENVHGKRFSIKPSISLSNSFVFTLSAKDI